MLQISADLCQLLLHSLTLLFVLYPNIFHLVSQLLDLQLELAWTFRRIRNLLVYNFLHFFQQFLSVHFFNSNIDVSLDSLSRRFMNHAIANQ